MNTQLTAEDKARIFAMYLGAYCRTETEDNLYVSDVGYRKDIEMGMLTVVSIDDEGEGWNVYNHFDEHKLILKDLSDISDEDAIEVAKIWQAQHLSDVAKITQVKHVLCNNKFYTKQTNLSGSLWSECCDYLRSKSYMLCYKGINLFDAGIAIRKTKTT